MFDADYIRKLKQVNVSANGEKTKLNTAEAWKSASREDQEKILALAGVSRSTVQRAYRTGSISAKLVVPIAQTLDIDPLYLTGEAFERGSCNEAELRNFLVRHGYKDAAAKKPRRTVRARKISNLEPMPKEQANNLNEVAEVCFSGVCSELPAETDKVLTSDEQMLLDCLTEEDMILQMKAILFRAKAGGKNAEIAKKLKLVLLGLE